MCKPKSCPPMNKLSFGRRLFYLEPTWTHNSKFNKKLIYVLAGTGIVLSILSTKKASANSDFDEYFQCRHKKVIYNMQTFKWVCMDCKHVLSETEVAIRDHPEMFE